MQEYGVLKPVNTVVSKTTKKSRLNNGAKCLILFVVFGVLSAVLIKYSFSTRTDVINYSESSLSDYKVCVKENDFYTEKCIEKGKQYIASIIDYIDIVLKYDFKADVALDYDYSYRVNADLVIYDRNNEKNELYSRNYELVSSTSRSEKDSKELSIKESIKIDYSEYNNLAERFKRQYNVYGESKLIVNLIVTAEGVNDHLGEPIKRYSTSSITVPLTENTINILMNSQDSNIEDKFVYTEKNINFILLSTGFALALTAIIFLGITIYWFGKKNKASTTEYERFIKRLRTEYGRYIVDAETLLNAEDYKMTFDVKTFEELLDKARIRDDNILCTVNEEERRTWFCIIQDDYLYRKIYNESDEIFE